MESRGFACLVCGVSHVSVTQEDAYTYNIGAAAAAVILLSITFCLCLMFKLEYRRLLYIT